MPPPTELKRREEAWYLGVGKEEGNLLQVGEPEVLTSQGFS